MTHKQSEILMTLV